MHLGQLHKPTIIVHEWQKNGMILHKTDNKNAHYDTNVIEKVHFYPQRKLWITLWILWFSFCGLSVFYFVESVVKQKNQSFITHGFTEKEVKIALYIS